MHIVLRMNNFYFHSLFRSCLSSAINDVNNASAGNLQFLVDIPLLEQPSNRPRRHGANLHVCLFVPDRLMQNHRVAAQTGQALACWLPILCDPTVVSHSLLLHLLRQPWMSGSCRLLLALGECRRSLGPDTSAMQTLVDTPLTDAPESQTIPGSL